MRITLYMGDIEAALTQYLAAENIVIAEEFEVVIDEGEYRSTGDIIFVGLAAECELASTEGCK